MKDYIYLINKEKGITSFKAISKVKLYDKDIKKIGHAGTLDPMAEGLLITMINDATKLSDDLMHQDKVYEVFMILGYETETLDLEGKIINIDESKTSFNEEEIIEAINSFKGEILQIPPKYSALKINGKKLYELARNDEISEEILNIKKREVTVYSVYDIEILNKEILKEEKQYKVYEEYVKKLIKFKVKVSSGTYIRSLVRDIGYQLGTYATMSKLKRLSIGNYTLDDVDKKISLSTLYNNSRIDINITEYNKLKNGVKIEKEINLTMNEIVNLYYNNEFVGLAIVEYRKKGLSILKKYKYLKRDTE